MPGLAKNTTGEILRADCQDFLTRLASWSGKSWSSEGKKASAFAVQSLLEDGKIQVLEGDSRTFPLSEISHKWGDAGIVFKVPQDRNGKLRKFRGETVTIAKIKTSGNRITYLVGEAGEDLSDEQWEQEEERIIWDSLTQAERDERILDLKRENEWKAALDFAKTKPSLQIRKFLNKQYPDDTDCQLALLSYNALSMVPCDPGIVRLARYFKTAHLDEAEFRKFFTEDVVMAFLEVEEKYPRVKRYLRWLRTYPRKARYAYQMLYDTEKKLPQVQ